MLDFLIRCLLTFLAIAVLYGLVILYCHWPRIRNAQRLYIRYGYTWATAWDLAGTDIAVSKRLKKLRRAA
jgi:hypothetical protein